MAYGITKEGQLIKKADVQKYCSQLKEKAEDLRSSATKIENTASLLDSNVLSVGDKYPAQIFDEVVEYLRNQANSIDEFADAAIERANEIYSVQYAEYTDYKNRNTNTVAVSSSTAAYSGNDVTNTVGGNSTNTVGNTVN